MTPSAIKHIDLIQTTITRMAANSFLLKGWAVTLVSAIFALAAKDANRRYIMVAYFPVILFWLLDGYYLSRERLFRALFDQVRASATAESDLSMDTTRFEGGKNKWAACVLSKTLLIFYGGVLGAILIVMFLL
jgi:hypothetical protein